MSFEAVAAAVSARPVVPSAIQAVEAADQPEGKEAALAVKSVDRLATLEGIAKIVKASEPPQILLGEPPHGMVPWVDVRDREAPFTSAFPQ
jgi:hypothetical protein